MSYRISVASDSKSWKNSYIAGFVKALQDAGHQVEWVHETNKIGQGDFLFILGFLEIIPKTVLTNHQHNLVVHESALPKGRGWSPMAWQVEEGASQIPITLFEASEKVDEGMIYIQDVVPLNGSELLNELRDLTIKKILELCHRFVIEYPQIVSSGRPQSGESSYYPRRTANSCQLDSTKSLEDQFDTLRVADNELYPAHFNHRGCKYVIQIRKDTSQK